jgi:hypothetical protein
VDEIVRKIPGGASLRTRRRAQSVWRCDGAQRQWSQVADILRRAALFAERVSSSRGLTGATDLSNQVLGAVRLRDEAPFVGHFSRARPPPPRSDDQLDMRPSLLNLTYQIHSVEIARQLNVGEDQVYVSPALQHPQRILRVRCFGNGKSFLFKDIGDEKAQERLVLDN